MILRRILRFCALLALTGLLVWGGGFFLFLDSLRLYAEPSIDSAAEPVDVIVVLTGGSERLETGLRLLESGKGKKLFVSGVYPGVSLAQVLGKNPVMPELRSSILLGYSADNTFGNAEETQRWMREEKAESLRLVTAYYHMPRSLLVFRAAMPTAKIIPHPVVPESVHLDAWWTRAGTTHLLVREYNKYLFAAMKVLLESFS